MARKPTGKPTTRITLEELQRRLLDPTARKEELSRYFLPDEAASGPFEPRVKLNPATVELPAAGAVRTRSALGLNIANGWMRLQRRIAFDTRIAGGYEGPVIVSEGDSWFQHPLLTDTIDHLSQRLGYAVRSLDAAGDTLENIVEESEYLDALEETEADVLLLSAGGNDALGGGNLVEHLREFDPGVSAEQHLLPSYRLLIDRALSLYDAIFRAVEARRPGIVTLCHGYDYAIPAGGRWLGTPMEERGITDPSFQREIVRVMVDGFNARLARLIRGFPSVRLVATRGAVGDGRWDDELHPDDSGYGTVADRFRDAMEEALKERPRAVAAAPARAAKGKAGAGRPAAPAVAARTSRHGLSLHVGVNTVDPAHYGSDAALFACEFDAEDMADVARNAGYEAAKPLLSAGATRKAVMDGIAGAAKQLKGGDIFLFTYAGHGSQMDDENGDEEDGIDETFCLFDGMMLDDELYDLWGRFADDVRVLVVSDSCHSGTNVRKTPLPVLGRPSAGSATAVAVAVAAEPAAPRVRLLPPNVAGRTVRRNREFYRKIAERPPTKGKATSVRALARPLRCSVQLLSGCQDNQVSLDGTTNGRFTTELLKVWRNGRFGGDYERFHRRIVAGMPPSQTPNFWATGRPNAAFRAQKPFSI